MKAKEFCLLHYPKARVLKVTNRGVFGKTNSFNIYPSREDRMWLVAGLDTESKAWSELKRKIIEDQEENT